MIGLLSFHESLSYGAILQCYALQSAIQKRNESCEFINYKRQPVSTAQLGGAWKYKMKRYVLEGVSVLQNTMLKSEIRKKAEAFNLFKKKYLKISEQVYNSYDELADAFMQYRAVVVGSDQVWNPVTTGDNLKVYGLSFLHEGIKKIAYAPSIGLGVLNESQEKRIKDCLGTLDYYSCREYTGAELLTNVLGKNIEYVLDPTFLLNRTEWNRIEKVVKTPSKYVLAYLLGSMSYERKLAKIIAERLGVDLLFIKESPKDMFSFKGIGGIGPDEMLYLISHAEFVITDSFHGTALSINYRKNFLCCNRRGYEKKTSYASRLTNLLHTFNLESRQVSENNWRDRIDLSVDYSIAENRISEMIIKSNRYLDKALGMSTK